MEFELRYDEGWNGRWRVIESMAIGNLEEIVVNGCDIQLDFGWNSKFIGTFSEDSGELEGLVYNNELPVDTLTFTRINDWTQIPAKLDENGKPLKTWIYQVPPLLDDGWPVAALSESNIAQRPLKELFQKVIDGKYQGLDAVLLAYKGQLVLEEYFHLGERNRIHSLESATKSVTSLLVGIASDEGLIPDVDAPIQSFFPTYIDSLKVSKPWPVTLKHALMMSAGLDWKEDIPYTDPHNDAVRLNNSADMYSYVLSRNMASGEIPGTQFSYNSGLSILLGGALLHATGLTADKYAEKTLFKRLGIKNYYWTSMTGYTHTGGGLHLRPRDLLKIGQLALNKGKWKGEQVVSEPWIKESTAFRLPLNASNSDWGYGYQWWRGVFWAENTKYEVIYAAGYGGQLLFAIPGLEIVMLVHHHNPLDFDSKHSIGWPEVEKVVIPAVTQNKIL